MASFPSPSQSNLEGSLWLRPLVDLRGPLSVIARVPDDETRPSVRVPQVPELLLIASFGAARESEVPGVARSTGIDAYERTPKAPVPPVSLGLDVDRVIVSLVLVVPLPDELLRHCRGLR